MLNEGQKIVVEEACKAYDRKQKVFQFSGGPGTGKSFTLKEIIRTLKIPEYRVAPMSYIGQAAIVMRLKGFPNAKTIHSWIYNTEISYKKDKNQNKMYDSYLGIPEEQLYFVPKSNLSDMIDLIIIDEAGTVPMRMKADIESYNIPIIATGDVNQLPPVADQPAYLYPGSGDIFFLTENMRQLAGSNIPVIAQRALQGLPIHHGFYGDVLVIYDDELTNNMIANADILLCGTNATRERLNKLVREEILHYKSTIPQCGEKIICRQNNWSKQVDGIGLGNGIIGRVANPIDISYYNGIVFYVDFAPDLFDGIFYGIDINYEYFTAPFAEKNEIKKKMMKYHIDGHCFDYAYCITTHLSQGAEYPNVIYFEEYTSPTIQNRLNFTGITRASRSLIYVKKRKQFFFN